MVGTVVSHPLVDEYVVVGTTALLLNAMVEFGVFSIVDTPPTLNWIEELMKRSNVPSANAPLLGLRAALNQTVRPAGMAVPLKFDAMLLC